jgi:hypothetical protein
MKPRRRSRGEEADDALGDLERLEAIAANTERKYGRVSRRLAEQLLDAQIDYAVAKDNLHDRFMEGD